MTRKAAYFELRADYFGRPLDDAILRALLANGFDVDVFSPDGELPQDVYPANVRRCSVDYRREWLQRHMRRAIWRDYDLFLGTADLPMAFAGSIAAFVRKPAVTVADEIYVGGYTGSATLYWKNIARWAMRRSVFTIVTDEVRIPLQREYASLPADHEFVQYPCCYPTPYDGRSRSAAREALGFHADDFVVSATGTFSQWNGAHWLVRLVYDSDIRALIQTAGVRDPVLDALLATLDGTVYAPERVGWRESAEITVAADVAATLYLSHFPQFQVMGVSSQKLCTALWLGIPVIATRQESFRFIEQYRCGELIESDAELAPAVARIRANREEYAANATRAVRDSIRPQARLEALTQRFRRL
ncbi:MAG TPA: hypothetical protein VEK79_08785 [Thermoanaerobaculia bacterium]|nr:hypothetical protein [Thermoanaerobaculia bacterium]